MKQMKQIYVLTTILFIGITNLNAQATDVVTGLNKPYALVLNGNDLYISEFNGNKISKIDITDATPTAIVVVTGLSSPTGLAISGNDLYISEYLANKISKIQITTLSVDENKLTPSIQLYPNPASDYIQLSNLTTTVGYTIYNMLGARIKGSNISNNEKIDVKNLTNGLYFIKFDSGNMIKFIKE